MDIIQRYLLDSGIKYEVNVSLKDKTWIKTGGICYLWITPETYIQLLELCKFLYSNGTKFNLIGQSSNVFFHSTYHPQVVVSTIKVNNYTFEEGNYIVCDCGVTVVKLAKKCMERGLGGFGGLVGLPGTVASAIVNNAGCFGCSLSSMLVSAECIMQNGAIRTLVKDDFIYSHRSSAFKRGELKGTILSIKFKSEKVADMKSEYAKAEFSREYRRNKQENSHRNLGSVYANRRMKKNVRNRFLFYLQKVLIRIGLLDDQRKFEKRSLLFLYGYLDLNPYISDRNINTYVWKDDLAETKFVRYKQFMAKVYDDLIIEIEEHE